jgi:hypothetical protein
MPQRKQVAKECLFCTNPANSKEHMWPRWILKRVDTREKIRRTVGQKTPYFTDSRQIKIKSVCTLCNNQWMSSLETQCVPVIGCLLEDISFALDCNNQTLVAQWATKIAMVLDSIEENPKKFYLKTDCENLKNTKAIPPGTTIWMGRYFGRSLHTGGTTFTALDESVPVADCSTTAIVVGHLILEVLSVRHRPNCKRVIQLLPTPGRWHELLVPVWPIISDHASWPPPLSFTSSGPLSIGSLVTRWKR